MNEIIQLSIIRLVLLSMAFFKAFSKKTKESKLLCIVVLNKF